jgi:hypothetical protein
MWGGSENKGNWVCWAITEDPSRRDEHQEKNGSLMSRKLHKPANGASG